MAVFSFLAAHIILPDTLAEYFSLLYGIPRNPCYGTASFGYSVLKNLVQCYICFTALSALLC